MELPINHFKHALRKGQPQIGLWSNLTSHISTEILADCGFDWLLLDMEHAPNELHDIVTQLQALKGSPSHPIVRAPWNDMVTFKRLLDLGTQSLLVPYIETEQEARDAVSFTPLPPSRCAWLCRCIAGFRLRTYQKLRPPLCGRVVSTASS